MDHVTSGFTSQYKVYEIYFIHPRGEIECYYIIINQYQVIMCFVTFLDQQNFDLFSTHLIYIQLLPFQAFLLIVGLFLFICYLL